MMNNDQDHIISIVDDRGYGVFYNLTSVCEQPVNYFTTIAIKNTVILLF